jgi:diacylglycerol kinase family enzyme
MGFETKVGFEAAKMKKVHSGIAYALGAIIMVARYDPDPLLEIEYGDTKLTIPAAIVSIMNGRRMGGIFFMGPNALLDDGAFDICYVKRPKSRRRLLRIVALYPAGRQAEAAETGTGRASSFHIKALEGGIAAHADGETVCTEGKELTISCIPGALRLIK